MITLMGRSGSAESIVQTARSDSMRSLPGTVTDHFFRLIDTATVEGRLVEYIHIYADAPDYRPVEASGEGITCVDDVARSVVLMCELYRHSGADSLLPHIRHMINFLKLMQADDGQFYNFLGRDHRINRTGITSVKSFGFWAARAVWAIGKAYHALPPSDYPLLDTLWERSYRQIEQMLAVYPKTVRYDDQDYPAYLVQTYSSDASAELLLGMLAYWEFRPDSGLQRDIEKIVEGIFIMSDTTGDGYCYFETYPGGEWHAWGASELQAIGLAARLLNRTDWRDRLLRDYVPFTLAWIAGRYPAFYRRIDHSWRVFPQIAYTIRPQVYGLIQLADWIPDGRIWAGLCLGWFFKLNPTGTDMVDWTHGRVYDGIESRHQVNRNSGAESTIEGLMALLVLNDYPELLIGAAARPLCEKHPAYFVELFDGRMIEIISQSGQAPLIRYHHDP